MWPLALCGLWRIGLWRIDLRYEMQWLSLQPSVFLFRGLRSCSAEVCSKGTHRHLVENANL